MKPLVTATLVLLATLVPWSVAPGHAQTAVTTARALHPALQQRFKKDPIGVVVKATSAMAMVKACPALVTVKPGFEASTAAILQYNDRKFGPGESDRDIAKKVKEHRDEIDCRGLTQAFKQGRYENPFLTTRK